MTKRELSALYEKNRGEGSKNRYLVAYHVFSTLPKEMRGSALLKEEAPRAAVSKIKMTRVYEKNR